jgi:hypothetical protein
LIFGGVIGGLIAFGVIGLFIGPVVLAVAYTLLQEWMNEAPDAEQVTRETLVIPGPDLARQEHEEHIHAAWQGAPRAPDEPHDTSHRL